MDNFEKKYNEALERARKIYGMIVNNEIIGFPEQIIEIFPVLRESRGERIRKKIIEHLEMIKNGSVICAIDTSEEIAWLEMQKEGHNGKKWIYEDEYQKDLERLYNDGKDEVLNHPKKYGLQKEQKPYGQRDECKDCQANYAGSCKGTCEMRQKEQKHAPDDLQKSFEAGQASIVDNPEQYGLCEKPAWSEEDEKMKERLITRLNWITHNTRTDGTSPNITFFDEIDWLKSLRPCPSWKPSEEQISSLKQARDYYMSGRIKYVGRHLSEIAEQLEKLM